MMWRVVWDDHEGKRRTLAFDRLADARLEAEALLELYDFVDIVREGGDDEHGT